MRAPPGTCGYHRAGTAPTSSQMSGVSGGRDNCLRVPRHAELTALRNELNELLWFLQELITAHLLCSTCCWPCVSRRAGGSSICASSRCCRRLNDNVLLVPCGSVAPLCRANVVLQLLTVCALPRAGALAVEGVQHEMGAGTDATPGMHYGTGPPPSKCVKNSCSAITGLEYTDRGAQCTESKGKRNESIHRAVPPARVGLKEQRQWPRAFVQGIQRRSARKVLV